MLSRAAELVWLPKSRGHHECPPGTTEDVHAAPSRRIAFGNSGPLDGSSPRGGSSRRLLQSDAIGLVAGSYPASGRRGSTPSKRCAQSEDILTRRWHS